MKRNRTMDQLEFDTTTDAQYSADLTTSKRRLLPEITDENASGRMTRLIDYLARFIGRHIRTWLNWVANQLFITTASDYDAIIQHSRRCGYIPEQEQPATATLTLTLNREIANDLTLNKLEVNFKTKRVSEDEDAITYEMDDDSVVIPSGSPEGYTATFGVTQGTTVPEETIGTSDGEEFQEFETEQGYAIEESETVEVYEESAWVEWTRTNNLYLTDPDDRVYEVLGYTEDGHMIIAFGSGDGASSGHGLIPPNEADIRITYRTLPGGQNGNVPAGKIVKPSPSTSVYDVTNAAAATGWAERETIEETRWTAQRYARVNQRCIKPEDYVAFAERDITGIGRVYVVPGELGENTIGVHSFDESGDPATLTKCQEVVTYLETLNPCDEHLVAIRGLLNEFDLSVKVWAASGYDIDTVISDVEYALDAYFDPLGYDDAGNRTLEPGQSVYTAHLLKIIQAVAGVDRAQIVSPTTTVSIYGNHLPALGTVTIVAGE